MTNSTSTTARDILTAQINTLTADQAAQHLAQITDDMTAREEGRMIRALLTDRLASLVPAVDAALDAFYDDLDSDSDSTTVALAAYAEAVAA